MTVASDVNKHIYTGNGVTRVWPYSFLLFDASHLQVWVKRGEADSVRLERGFVLNEQARTVTYPVDGTGEAPLSSQDKIILRRELPIIQDTDLKNQGAFFAETHEQTFDKIVMMIQQLSETLSRAVVGPVDQTDSGVAYQTLLDAVEEAKRARNDAVAAMNSALSTVKGFDAHATAAFNVFFAKLDAAVAKAKTLIAVYVAEAESWAEASCGCASRTGEIVKDFVIAMQAYKGLYVRIPDTRGGSSRSFVDVSAIADGGNSASPAFVQDIADGQTSHAGTWYEIDPVVLQALNPKGIVDVSEIDENGEITITIDNTL